jgi:hypothetical protein
LLEGIARREGIATRVRGIAVEGSFWYPRFPQLHWLVPVRVILAWPDFRLDGQWMPVSHLFGSLDEMAACGSGFSNSDGETLFDAIARTAVDWDGSTGTASCDLSAEVREDLGYFDSRDDLFQQCGQTLCRLARSAGDSVLSRHSARV